MQRLRRGLGRAKLFRHEAIPENAQSGSLRKRLLEQLDFLGGQFRLSVEQSRDVAARSRKTFYIAPLDRIVIDGLEHNRNAAACADDGLQRGLGTLGNDQIELQ